MNEEPASADAVVADLARWIQPGDTVIWGQAQAEPSSLVRALVAQRHRIVGTGKRIRVLLGIGGTDTLQPEHADAMCFTGYSGAGHRALAREGLLDIVPVHYSQLPQWIRSGALRVDVAMLQLPPPNAAGEYSLGMANEYLLAALDSARTVLAEVQPQAPWTHGERVLSADQFALRIEAQTGMPEPGAARLGEVERAIGRHVAALVDDGVTLQTGVGSIPDAVLDALAGHRRLGVHTGALTQGMVALAEGGAITNEAKTIDRGVSVAGVLMGGSRLRQWAHLNQGLRLRGTEYTHHPEVLAGHDRLVAINGALQVDLTGQVNAESLGGDYLGAVGGAVDFLRGAARSRGGLPIVALPSTAGSRSRIVATLNGPVSTSRADAAIIVTEHGVADLRGATVAQRMDRMLSIAAPEHRAALAQQFERGHSIRAHPNL